MRVPYSRSHPAAPLRGSLSPPERVERTLSLEVVQEQLSHTNIKTTTIYAKVTNEDTLKAANALAEAYRLSQKKREAVARWPKRTPQAL